MKDAKLILLVLKIEKPTMENSKHSSYGASDAPLLSALGRLKQGLQLY